MSNDPEISIFGVLSVLQSVESLVPKPKPKTKCKLFWSLMVDDCFVTLRKTTLHYYCFISSVSNVYTIGRCQTQPSAGAQHPAPARNYSQSITAWVGNTSHVQHEKIEERIGLVYETRFHQDFKISQRIGQVEQKYFEQK